MGRPWEYPRWRRVLMQALMWCVFIGSLGLAHLLAHSRANEPGRLVQAGIFLVRLPDDFTVDPTVREFDLVAHNATGDRRLFISTAPLSFEGRSVSPRYDGQIPVEFPRLHATGVMMEQQRPASIGEGGATNTTLIAMASLPKLRRTIVVGLDVGDDDISNGDQALLRKIVNGIEIDGKSNKVIQPIPRPGTTSGTWGVRLP